MPRSIWRGAISFGMVSIPVKLYGATESKEVALHLLHRDCNSRIKQLRWCPVHEREVPWDQITHGYEYAKDLYVVVTEQDIENLPVPSKHTIALSAFVNASEIDPVYYQKSYYLEPDEMGVKPYVLLERALTEKRLTALASITIRTKERLCALRPRNGMLILETLFYGDEIRLPQGASLPAVDVGERELAMAFSFIDLLSEEFAPNKFVDRYREALLKLIEAKMQGREVVAPAAPPSPKVVDLMAALKASVDAAKKRREEATPVPQERSAGRGRMRKAG